MIKVALLHTTIRGDEKLLMEAAKRQNVYLEIVDIRNQILDDHFVANYAVALERSVATIKGDYMIKFLQSKDIRVVNDPQVAAICGDKFITSLYLRNSKVPTPDFAMAFTYAQALEAINMMGGFPVILKPPIGSWGRLLCKVNDTDALESIIEHKDVFASPQQNAYYIQKFVHKPGRDIRTFVVGDKVLCAIYRTSDHWITNTARGGKATNCPLTPDLIDVSMRASKSVGGGILALDIFETDDGFSVNEINHTMEFKNSEEPTGVSISSEIISYCVSLI